MLTAGRLSALAVLSALLLWPVESRGGEAFVTRVRGSTLTVDKGAEEGLEVGMRIEVIRPPKEAIIHPLTGENLGAPEITLGAAEVTRISARGASARLLEPPLMPVRPGDLARFMTLEEKMLREQDQATEVSEKAAAERQEIRGQASRLTRNIRSIQATIRGLESAITDLRRFDKDVVQPQFRAINRDIEGIKEKLAGLERTVMLAEAVRVRGDPGAAEMDTISKQQIEQLRQLIEEEVRKLQADLDMIAAGQPEQVEMPDVPTDTIGLEDLEEEPFYTKGWFFGLLAAIGLGGVGFWLWTQVSGGGDEDDEEEEDEEMALDDDLDEEDEDVEVEVEDEEDDIVVEETS